MGLSDKTYKDWNIWTRPGLPNAIVTKGGPDAKYKTMPDLLAALKAKNPVKSMFGTAGVGSGGYMGAEVLKLGTKLAYKHIAYQVPAIIGGLSGEVDVVPQLLMEMVDHIRAGKMNALAVLMDQPFKLSGAADIPAVTSFVSSKPMGESSASWCRKDTPANVVQAIDFAFKSAAVKSETVKAFAAERRAPSFWRSAAKKHRRMWRSCRRLFPGRCLTGNGQAFHPKNSASRDSSKSDARRATRRTHSMHMDV